MAIGLVGRKSGMTRVFTEDGASVPVTVIEVEPNRVTQIKNADTDGYTAVQVTTGSVKQNRVRKPQAGHFAKASTPAGRIPPTAASRRPAAAGERSTGTLYSHRAGAWFAICISIWFVGLAGFGCDRDRWIRTGHDVFDVWK